MADYRAVTLADIPHAPAHLAIDFPLAADRRRVWELLALDPARWGEFCPGFDHSGHWVERTPGGAGSVRRVRVGGLRFTESVLAEDAAERWAFRVDAAAVGAAEALAEDYRLADAPGGCVLHWSAGVWPRGPVWLARPLVLGGFRVFAGMLARGLERAAQG